MRNFALVYLEMAMERASAEARAAVLPELLQGIGSKPAQHRDMLLRMAMAGLQHFSTTGAMRKPSSHFSARQHDGERHPAIRLAGHMAHCALHESETGTCASRAKDRCGQRAAIGAILLHRALRLAEQLSDGVL